MQARTEGRAIHALLAIDLDGFTRVHACFGPAAAERLLLVAGHRIRQCLGGDDEMARVGADEFHVLVACDGNASHAWRVAELLLHALTGPYALEDRQVAITACVGIALVQPHHGSPADVARDAFAAVHRAKSAGAARCALFDAGMHEATLEQLRLAAELRNAIERGEFRMHYQPIVHCRSGELVSLEALIRWEHPTRGCLSPAEFLDALVHADLMSEVGRWIIGEVTRQSVAWREESGFAASIAINVSPRQLSDPKFLPHLLAALAATGTSPQSFVFEMTEEIELGKGDAPMRALNQLRDAGFRVFIDDFGTGYSSLSYLQHLSIDGLKIDRGFIRNLDVDVRQREIVSAIVRLAHALDLVVVAEGVERSEQLDVLRALGCDLVQGHLLAHPLAAAQMGAWLSQLH